MQFLSPIFNHKKGAGKGVRIAYDNRLIRPESPYLRQMCSAPSHGGHNDFVHVDEKIGTVH